MKSRKRGFKPRFFVAMNKYIYTIILMWSMTVEAFAACNAVTALQALPNGLLSLGQRGEARLQALPVLGCVAPGANAEAASSLNLPRLEVTAASAYSNSLWIGAYGGVIGVSHDSASTWQLSAIAAAESLPILDIHFASASKGYAVGSLGLYLETSDAGVTWQRKTVFIDPEWEEPDDLSLNSIVSLRDGTLIIAAEAGAVYRKKKTADAWEKLSTGYEGSYFRAVAYGRKGVVVAGLGGTVHISRNAGDSWEDISAQDSTGIFAILPLSNGELLMAGAAGKFYLSSNGARQLRLLDLGFNGTAADLAVYRERLYVATERGLQAFTLDELK